MPDDSSSPAAPTPGPAPERAPAPGGEPAAASADEPPPQEPGPDPDLGGDPVDPAEKPDWRHWLLGAPRDIGDPHTFHNISLIALLAWVGLGADGLSSSAYGPDEAFRALGAHTYLAVALALATALTVLVISVAYSQIIEHFPSGGGGYVVATKLLGPHVGVVSGCGAARRLRAHHHRLDRLRRRRVFSFLPGGMAAYKRRDSRSAVIVILLVMNLRGVKESVTALAPIFVLFLVTHAILRHRRASATTWATCRAWRARSHARASRPGSATLGLCGHARALPARLLAGRRHVHRHRGGLERPADHARAAGRRRAAHHGLMAISLALTAGGILLCYLLFHVAPADGQDDERRARSSASPAAGTSAAAGRARLRDDHAVRRGGAALRRRAGRLHRRPARHGEHGDRLVAAAPLRAALRAARPCRTACC